VPPHFRFERLRRLGMLATALIVACGLLAACASGNDDTPKNSSTPKPTETPLVEPTALTGAPRIGEAVWTSAIQPETNEPIALAPEVGDPTIYAVFPIESLPAGSQLVASWFFNDTSLDALNSAMRIDRDRVSGWIEFHIERTGTEPWPDGEYEIVVTDGTNELQRSVVTIS
jgi:hypothetical protein